MKAGFILCLLCFGSITIYNFIRWTRGEKEMNDFLGWVLAFVWCLIANSYMN